MWRRSHDRTAPLTLAAMAMVVALAGTSAPGYTQGSITGQIRAADTHTPLAGAMVSVERAAGWSRQLRLTPLHPVAYVGVKVVVAMTMGLAAVVVVGTVGITTGADLPVGDLVACGLLGWLCSLVFAAFGLFMGYLLPSENVMQILGPALALMSFAGGLFVPVDNLGDTFATIAKLTPVYGVGEIARWPLDPSGSLAVAILNVAVWTAVFGAGAVWRFHRDTARV